MLKDLY